MANIIEIIFKKFGYLAVIFAVAGAVFIWGIAHWAAAPGSEVSILFGLAKYKKRAPQTQKTIIDSTTISPATESSDNEVIAGIMLEGPDLLKRTKSAPGGFWLMAKATTSTREELLQLADEIKPEARAEALAHLAYTLTVYGRNKDAQSVAESSLSAVEEQYESSRQYSLDDLAVIFEKAKLEVAALKAADRAIDLSKSSGKTLGLSRLARVLVRISTLNHAKSVAGNIKDPKERREILSAIVNELIVNDRTQEAGDVFQETYAASLLISKASDRATALSDNTKELFQLGRYKESRKIAKEAKIEAQKIDPEELFGELTIKLVTFEMSLYEHTSDELILFASQARRPDVLVRIAWHMPKVSPETKKVLEAAQTLAIDIEDPIVMSDVSNLLNLKGWPDDGVNLAKKATQIALQSNNPRSRSTTLEKTSKIFADAGDFKKAFEAADGIDDVEDCAKVMANLLCRCYARNETPGEKVLETLSRVSRSCRNLNDEDRSEVLMFLAVSHAMLGNYAEAYKYGNQAPLSGHRLAAYSIIVLRYELQQSPDLEKQVKSTHDEALMVMLEPIFGLFGLR